MRRTGDQPGNCAVTAPVAFAPGALGIFCACHGSAFRIEDGSVVNGPARNPLPAYALRIDGPDVLVDTGAEVAPGMRFG